MLYFLIPTGVGIEDVLKFVINKFKDCSRIVIYFPELDGVWNFNIKNLVSNIIEKVNIDRSYIFVAKDWRSFIKITSLLTEKIENVCALGTPDSFEEYVKQSRDKEPTKLMSDISMIAGLNTKTTVVLWSYYDYTADGRKHKNPLLRKYIHSLGKVVFVP